MKNKTYKSPSDYPQFAFRLSKQDKVLLNSKVTEIHAKINKSKGDLEFKIKKNEIILRAILIGLIQIEKKIARGELPRLKES